MHILVIGAHPDDCEGNAAGSAALWKQRGDAVKFVSVTNGDAGHFAEEYRCHRERLATRRLTEAERAAAVIGIEYETLGVPDGEVYVTPDLTRRIVQVIRSFGSRGPDLVIINRPVDYHRDHRYTSQLVLDASYMLTVPFYCPETPAMTNMPVICYWHDRFTELVPFTADVVVPIDDVIDIKLQMMACHESQYFEWLVYNSGRLAEVPADPRERLAWLRPNAEGRGTAVINAHAAVLESLIGPNRVRWGEAFRVSEYGRRPTPEELLRLFPLNAWLPAT